MKKYGLIGYPLTHSFSKRFFTEKFEKENINSSYDNFEIENIRLFPEIIKNNPGVVGLNVTIPYKEQVIPFLDEINDSAKQIGAVNTVKIIREGSNIKLKGFNTDTFGFETSLQPLLKNKLGIDYISASIEELKEKEIRYNEIDEKMMNERLLIINATPLGTYPKVDNCPDIPYEFITEKHLLFDLVYNPEVTLFMQKGLKKGATVKNGYEMLLLQAIKSYQIWNEE